MDDKVTIDEDEQIPTKDETDETGAITVIGHLLIVDKETGEELVNKRA